jgi:hypothetical protein
MTEKATRDGSRGMALVIVLLFLMLGAAISASFAALVMNEHRQQLTDKDRTQAFYGAHAGLEKATSDLGVVFASNYAPRGPQVNALDASPPSIPGVTFVTTSEGPGYDITFTPDANGDPTANPAQTITVGPYQGLIGLATPYHIWVTGSTTGGGEVRLHRELQTVSIPVFQFGIFSETDLSFFAGPDFDFGGRVHTNGNLFLASGSTLDLSDKVTALGEIIRTHLSNGWSTSSGYTGTVRGITSPGVYRALAVNEGSLVGTLGSARNEPTWTNVSNTSYNGNIRNGRTGARRLDLPLITIGSTPIEMIKRPTTGETTATPVFALRYFSMASLRILLSDAATDITSLPTVAGTPETLGPVTPAWYLPASSARPLWAISQAEAAPASAGMPGNFYNLTNAGSTLLGGVIKIDMQTQSGNWVDVTQEIMRLGIGAANASVATCADPSPDAVIRLQRVRDNPSISTGGGCGTVAGLIASDYWPLVLYDSREGILRDSEPTTQTTMHLGGGMHYIELDMLNLRRWLLGQIGTSGTQAFNHDGTGYVLYFSDRRTNNDAAGSETGEYGNEDFVNPASTTGTPNGSLDTGEDVNGNGTLDTYGRTVQAPAGLSATANSVLTWTPERLVNRQAIQVNPPLFFRRALKVTNGAAGNIITPGLTIASENPVYVEGNFNSSGSFTGTHAATAIIADAVTFLSNAWRDHVSFTAPNDPGTRNAATTWYRVGIISGKGPSFPRPTAGNPAQDFGTDGGVHNFLRYIESWSGDTLNYRGSIGSLYFSRQAVGTYKCCTNVYSPPTRAYTFDTDFSNPNLLPPKTPVFRDINVLGFTQVFTIPQ